MNPQSVIFWDVDTQVDFMLPAGKLYVPGAERIIPKLAALTGAAAQHGIVVLASMDAHEKGDPEFAEYPPHCMKGTSGQAKIPETRIQKQLVIPNRKLGIPGTLNQFQQIVVEKQRFDVFTNPNMPDLLKSLGQRKIVLYGVVTEICVAAAARGLLERDYQVTLVTDAIRALDEDKGNALIEEVRTRGGTLRSTDDILAEFV